MAKSIRLVIDSVVGDNIQILITRRKKTKVLTVNAEFLSGILTTKKFVEGRSYSLTFEDDDEFKAFISGKIEKPKEKLSVKVKGTTRKDRERVRELQRALGLKV